MKKIISIISAIVILTAAIASAALAANPRFNFEANDLKTLAVANRTTNSGWQNDSISANSGNQVAFQVYYRNGVIDTIAKNTRVRLNFPTTEQNYINVSVSLSADNASTVTDNVAINSAVPQKLVFDSANIYWYPDQSPNATILPATAAGAGYIELNIGDIADCWLHQGYVTFYASLTPASVYTFSIQKTVRNLTTGQAAFAETADAQTEDHVIFKIEVANTGNAALNNVYVLDNLPYQFAYINDSTKVDGLAAGNGIASGGLNIGSIGVGLTKTITFEAVVVSCSSCVLQTSVTNYGSARADLASEKNDSAQVRISSRACSTGDPASRPVF